MVKIEKLLAKMKNNPKNISKKQIITIAEYYGCIIKERGKGSHFSIKHDSQPDRLMIPTRTPIKTIYVKQFLTYIEKVIENE